MADCWTAQLYDIHCGQISITTATRIKMWRNVFPFCLEGFLLNRSRSQSWSPLDIWKSSQMCMNEFLINLDFYILGTDSLYYELIRASISFGGSLTDTGRVGGGVLAADIAILKLESGSRLIIMKTVWEMLLIDQFPPPRPGPGLRHNSGLWKNVRSKSEHAPRLGPGALHTGRVTAAWCMQLLSSNKHFSCPQLWCCEGRPDSWSANWPRDLAILGSFIIIIRAKTTLYFFQAAIYLLVSLFGFQ